MEAVWYYIEEARSGRVEDAFHGLRELHHDAIPALQSAYLGEDDPIVRALLVEAIWQHRQHSTIDFLADALRDPAPIVWKQALDGLVTLTSLESIQALQLEQAWEVDLERRAWIEEAIDQVTEAVTNRTLF